MIKTFLVVAWLISLLGVFITTYTGLFVVLSALITVSFFWFSITYPTREEVKLSSKLGMTFLNSPFPWLILTVIAIGYFFLWLK